MRIGVFSDSYKPYVSGVVNSIESFTRELRDLGHEVYIFAPEYRNYQDLEPNIFRFPSVPAPTNRDFTLAIPVSLDFPTRFRNLNLDLIHVHSPFILGQLGAKQARKFKLPLVFTYHTLYEQYLHYVPLSQNITREFVVRLSRSFCNDCDLVITPTRAIQDLLQGYGVHKPIQVLPTGIDLARFSQGDSSWLRQRLTLGDKEKILLFVGRLTKEKNVDFLIRAFALIHEQNPETVLVIVARGPEEEALRQLTKELGLTEQVRFMGAQSGQELVNCYHGADLFVFSSVTETQGLVLLEAMAAQLPVVAVDAFGVSDMVSNRVDGILTSHSIGDFAQEVVFLLQNPNQYAAMRKAAQDKAHALSATQVTKRLEAAYRSLFTANRKVDL